MALGSAGSRLDGIAVLVQQCFCRREQYTFYGRKTSMYSVGSARWIFSSSGNSWSVVFWRHCTDCVAVEMLVVDIKGLAVCLVACPVVRTRYVVANGWVRAAVDLPPQTGAWGCRGGQDVYSAVRGVVMAGLMLGIWGQCFCSALGCFGYLDFVLTTT